MKFEQMTPVQASVIPMFMGNRDVVVEVSSIAQMEEDERRS